MISQWTSLEASLPIIGALHRLTDPIRYVSSILSIDIRYVSQYFSHYPSNRLQTNGNLRCRIVISWRYFYDLNITFLDAKPITNLNNAFISYTLQSLCD